MKKFLALLASSAMIANAIPANAATAKKVNATQTAGCRMDPRPSMTWEHPGRAPAYLTKEEARKHIADHFRCVGYSEQDVNDIVAYVSSHAGEKAMIVNGNKFDHMESAHGVIHSNVTVGFTTPPPGVRKGTGGIFLTATVWRIPLSGGRMLWFTWPDICNNLADILLKGPPPPPPPPVAEKCQEDWAWAEQGHHIQSGLAMEPGAELQIDDCNAYMLPGETTWRSDFHVEPCPEGDEDCTLQRPLNDLNQKLGIHQHLQGGLTIGFVAETRGWFKRRWVTKVAAVNSDYHHIVCDEIKEVAAAQYLGWRETGSDTRRFIVYHPDQIRAVAPAWSGHAITWNFKQRTSR